MSYLNCLILSILCFVCIWKSSLTMSSSSLSSSTSSWILSNKSKHNEYLKFLYLRLYQCQACHTLFPFTLLASRGDKLMRTLNGTLIILHSFKEMVETSIPSMKQVLEIRCFPFSTSQWRHSTSNCWIFNVPRAIWRHMIKLFTQCEITLLYLWYESSNCVLLTSSLGK